MEIFEGLRISRGQAVHAINSIISRAGDLPHFNSGLHFALVLKPALDAPAYGFDLNFDAAGSNLDRQWTLSV